MQESQESERQRTFLPLHASSLPFPAFHLRCRVPKISKLAASFLPRPPLKLSHCDEWSLRCDWERRCFLSVPVEVAVASVFLRRAKFFALHICGSVCVWTGFSTCICVSTHLSAWMERGQEDRAVVCRCMLSRIQLRDDHIENSPVCLNVRILYAMFNLLCCGHDPWYRYLLMSTFTPPHYCL